MVLLCGAVSFNLSFASAIEIYHIITERELQKKLHCCGFFPSGQIVPLDVGCVVISSRMALSPKMLFLFLTNTGPLATRNSPQREHLQDALIRNISVACTALKRGPAKLHTV